MLFPQGLLTLWGNSLGSQCDHIIMQALETNYFIEMGAVEDTVSKNVFLSLAAVREPGTCKYSKHIGRVPVSGSLRTTQSVSNRATNALGFHRCFIMCTCAFPLFTPVSCCFRPSHTPKTLSMLYFLNVANVYKHSLGKIWYVKAEGWMRKNLKLESKPTWYFISNALVWPWKLLTVLGRLELPLISCNSCIILSLCNINSPKD